MKEVTKVCILLATYNGVQYVSAQLQSIYNQVQGLHPFYLDVFISDDHSSDDTVAVMMRDFPQGNIISCARKGGAAENFKYLLEHVPDSYDLYFFADQDDIWLPHKISSFIDQFIELPRDIPCLLHSDLRVVDQDLHVIHDSMFNYQGLSAEPTFRELLVQNSVTGCAMAVNSVAMKTVRGMTFDCAIMHDWFIALICSAMGKVVCVPSVTVLYRQHENNQLGAVPFSFLSLLRKLLHTRKEFSLAVASLSRTARQAYAVSIALEGSGARQHAAIAAVYSASYSRTIFNRFRCLFLFRFRKCGFWRNTLFIVIYLFAFAWPFRKLDFIRDSFNE